MLYYSTLGTGVDRENIDNQIIPTQINQVYEEVEKSVNEIMESYRAIKNADVISFQNGEENNYQSNSFSDVSHKLQLVEVREKEIKNKIEELETKVKNGVPLTPDERYQLVDSYEQSEQFSKARVQLILEMSETNKDYQEAANSRSENETTILENQNNLSLSMQKLSNLLEQLDANNMGLDRLDQLEVRDSHIAQFTETMERLHGGPSQNTPTASRFYTESMLFKVEYLKALNKAATDLVTQYTGHQELKLSDEFIQMSGAYGACDHIYQNLSLNNLEVSDFSKVVDTCSKTLHTTRESLNGSLSEEEYRSFKDQQPTYDDNSTSMGTALTNFRGDDLIKYAGNIIDTKYQETNQKSA